jgi:methionyl-tRNA synthetase
VNDLCPICGERDSVGLMCKQCGRSYDRDANNDGTVWEAMRWAAERARRFERRRQQRRRKTR